MTRPGADAWPPPCDRRYGPRRVLSFPCRLATRDRDCAAILHDLGYGGGLVEVRDAALPSRDRTVDMILDGPHGGPLALRGRVVRTRGDRAAVAFTEPLPRRLAALGPLVAPSATGALRVAVARSSDEIAAEEWDSILGPDDFLCTHAFLRSLERSGVEQAEYWFLRFYLRPGAAEAERLVAVAVLHTMVASVDMFVEGTLRYVLQTLRHLYGRFLIVPVLFCGLPLSLGGHALVFAPDAPRRAVVERLGAVMETLARRHGLPLLCCKEFPPALLPPLDAALPPRGFFRCHSLPYAYLANPWDDFEAYLGSLRAGYRRQVRTARAAAARAGLQVREAPLPSDVTDLLFLYLAVMERAPVKLEVLNRAFFEGLLRSSGEGIRLLEARCADGPLEGFALLHEGEGSLRFLLTGLHHERARLHQTYFNLYEAILRKAMGARIPFVGLGQTSYHVKTRLGASLNPLHIFLKHRDPILNRLLAWTSRLLFPATVAAPRRVFRA